MQAIRIRPAALSDVDHLVAHRSAMFLAMGRDPMKVARGEEAAKQYFESALPDGSCRAWVAADDDKVVGGGCVVIVHWPGSPDAPFCRRAWILNIYVEPSYRRGGIARQIMETLVAWCRSEGFTTVALHASDEGRPLYESMGFVPTNEMRLTL